jgi:hypothetical protein
MTDVPDQTDHRALAVAAFNASWTLLEQDRTEAEDLELLEVAFASRHHWRQVGGPQQAAIADWMVSRCFAELGEGRLAVRFAVAARDATPSDAPAWMRASVFEGLARAYAADGQAAARDDACRRAEAELATERDDEERALIAEQLRTVPEVAS